MILVENYVPNIDETLEEYKYRLFEVKEKEKELRWTDIQYLLDYYFDYKKSTDFIRHEAYSARKVQEISEINVGTRILSISDTHVPFNLDIRTLKDYRNKVDVLVLNGDILDCQGISKFSKTYRVPLMEEMIKGREFIIDAIEYINPKKVIINYGNHEKRFQAYLAKKLDPEMLELMPDTALDMVCDLGFYHYDQRLRTRVFYEPLTKVFENTGIEVEYTKNWWCQVGKTILCHPSAFSSGILKTSEKAMQYFLQERVDFDSLIMSHTHQVGYTYFGKIHLFEQGCFCHSEEMSYADGKLYKSQTNGVVYICQDKTGNLLYDKSRLVLL